MDSALDIGKMIHQFRKERQLTLKYVADKLEIDLSMLSKIENGDRQIQGHMLKPLSELFKIDYKDLQIKFLNQKIEDEFGDEPFIEEAVSKFLTQRSK